MIISNRKAYFEYHIIKEFDAGIMLVGSEVKSIMNNDASISEAYIYSQNNELFIKGMYINKYTDASLNNHVETRDRKLLLNKKEIREIIKETENTGITIIPLGVFIKNRKIKLKIAISKGKKLYDKRNSIKERDIKREIKNII
jgi:SsrA-binding protein